MAERNILRLPCELPRIRKKPQTLALLIFSPLTFPGAVWIVGPDDLKLPALPFIEAFAVFLEGTIPDGLPLKAGLLHGFTYPKKSAPTTS